MKRITRDERTGVIILAVLALVMIGGSFAWRQYSARRFTADDSANAVIAEIIAQDTVADDEVVATKKIKSRKRVASGSKKNGRKSSSVSKETRRPAVAPRDPLSDTVTLKQKTR